MVGQLNDGRLVVVAARWAVLDRVEAAGLLPRTSGPHWSVFEKFRKAPIIDTLLDAGDIEEVQSTFFFLFPLPPSSLFVLVVSHIRSFCFRSFSLFAFRFFGPVEGSRTVYLAPKGWTDRQFPDFDDRMRIIAPLDPLVWHRYSQPTAE